MSADESTIRNEFEQYLPAFREVEPPQIVEIPSSLSQLDQRHPPLLSRPYRNVGLEAMPERETSVVLKAWQLWTVVGFVMAIVLSGAIAVFFSAGAIALALSVPVFGLVIASLCRTVQAERTKAKQKQEKAERRARRLRDMRS